MALETLLLVRLIESVSLIVGLTIVYVALKAHRKSKQKSMLILALGFILLTFASLVEGLLFEVLHYDLVDSHAATAAVKAAGLITVLISIYGNK